MKIISYCIKHLFKKRWAKVALVAALLVTPALVLSGCGKSAEPTNTVSVGILGNYNRKIFDPLAKQMKRQYHVHLKIVDFSDNNQPDQALQHHEIDTNAFQTEQMVTDYNKSNHAHIVSVGKTGIAPLNLYSTKIHKLSQLKPGDTITVPNNTSSEGHALNALSTAGLIKTKKGVEFPTVSDITKNPKHLHIKQVDPAQTPRTLKDATASVIANVFALDAKIPNKDCIYSEKITKKDRPYINVISTNKSDKNRKTVKDLVKAYHSKENLKRFKRVYHGTAIPAWNLKL